MTELTPNQAAMLEAAANLDGKMDDLNESFAKLLRRIRVMKRVIAGLVVALVLAAAGVVIGIVVAVSSNHAAHKAQMALSKANLNQQIQINTCQQTNQARASAKDSWLFFYDALLASPKSATQPQAEYDKAKKTVEALRARIVKEYAPRNCSPKALGKH